jgi:hypothetical protein
MKSSTKRVPQPQPEGKPAAPSSGSDVDPAVVGEWTGGLAAALRRARRDNIYDFAASLGAGPSTVDAWDKDPTIVPKSKIQRALDLALEDASGAVKKRFGLLVKGNRVVGVPDSLGLDGNGGDTNRDQALKVMGSYLVAACVPEEVVERIVGDRAGRVDLGLLDGYEHTARVLMEEYLAGDPRVVTPLALAQANDVLGLLQREVANRRRLEALVVGVNARVGKWAFHDGDLRAARKHLLIAVGLAAASGDRALLAQRLARRASCIRRCPGAAAGVTRSGRLSCWTRRVAWPSMRIRTPGFGSPPGALMRLPRLKTSARVEPVLIPLTGRGSFWGTISTRAVGSGCSCTVSNSSLRACGQRPKCSRVNSRTRTVGCTWCCGRPSRFTNESPPCRNRSGSRSCR